MQSLIQGMIFQKHVYLIVILDPNLFSPLALWGCGHLGRLLFLFHIREDHFFKAVKLKGIGGTKQPGPTLPAGSLPLGNLRACTSYSFSSVQLISSKSPSRLAAGRRWSKKMENSSCRWSWPLRSCHICVLSWGELWRLRRHLEYLSRPHSNQSHM